MKKKDESFGQIIRTIRLKRKMTQKMLEIGRAHV